MFDLNTLNVPRETPFTPLTAIPEPSTRVRTRRPGAVLADQAPRGLSADEIDMYRTRLARGFYRSAAIQAEVARRLLESGDI